MGAILSLVGIVEMIAGALFALYLMFAEGFLLGVNVLIAALIGGAALYTIGDTNSKVTEMYEQNRRGAPGAGGRTWRCPKCGEMNLQSKGSCAKCGTGKP